MVSALKYRDTHILICSLSIIWSSCLQLSKKKISKKRTKNVINLMIILFIISGIISITELCNQYNYYARFIEFMCFTCGFGILIIALYYYSLKFIMRDHSRVAVESLDNASNPVSNKLGTEDVIENNQDIIVNVDNNSSSIV
tara:strand:+ start:252 stop:677 length:426 start_codon:yes stop_codon:yes gene_type:complete